MRGGLFYPRPHSVIPWKYEVGSSWSEEGLVEDSGLSAPDRDERPANRQKGEKGEVTDEVDHY